MLSQIELGQSAPTVTVLWKIARALDLPFSSFLAVEPAEPTQVVRRSDARRLLSADGSLVSRALFSRDFPTTAAFYEITIAPRSREEAEPHPIGATESLVVFVGTLDVQVGSKTVSLTAGDSITFSADHPHAYSNATNESTTFYLLMTCAKAKAR